MRVPILTFALLFSAARVDAQTQQVRRGPTPKWVTPSAMLPIPEVVSGPVFIRRQDVAVHLSDQGQAQYLGYRVKILQSSALQLGNIAITWSSGSPSPIVHEIKLFRDGQVIDALKNSSFDILRREDQLEAAMLDGKLTAVMRISDLRVGDELEVDLTAFENDPTLGRNSAGLLALPPGPSPGRYHLNLTWETSREPGLKITQDMVASMTKGVLTVDFRFDNPGFLSPPKDAPPRYSWQRIVQYSNFTDWAALSRHFAPIYAKAATLASGSSLKAEATRIAAAQPNPFDRAAAALRLVQQNVRYIYVGLNGGNYTPAPADETWKRRYGDCKGKTAMLLALLAQLGIDAEAVLVNTNGADDGLNERLPIPQLFDHVLVRARMDGKAYWLDGTLPPVAAPSTDLIYPVRWMLPLKEQGSQLERIDWHPATAPDEISLFEMDARAGFDKPARIVSTNILRGIKGLQQELQFSTVTAAQLLDVFRQKAIGDTWQTIDDVKWHYDEKAAASILTISGTGTLTWDHDDNGGKSMALPGGGFSPPERRLRASDQNRDAPFYSIPEYTCHVTTVLLPSSTQPKQWSSKPSFDSHFFGREYYRAWELRDGSIRMVRGSRVEQPEITASAAQQDNARIAQFDNSMGYIFYDPTGRKSAVGSGESVPTSFDFDWTNARVPCLHPTG